MSSRGEALGKGSPLPFPITLCWLHFSIPGMSSEINKNSGLVSKVTEGIEGKKPLTWRWSRDFAKAKLHFSCRFEWGLAPNDCWVFAHQLTIAYLHCCVWVLDTSGIGDGLKLVCSSLLDHTSDLFFFLKKDQSLPTKCFLHSRHSHEMFI